MFKFSIFLHILFIFSKKSVKPAIKAAIRLYGRCSYQCLYIFKCIL